MALGDVAGLVDPGEEERHALLARPLQGRKPVRHLLDTSRKAISQQHQIVAQFPRGGRERAIGQQRSAGEIIGKPDAANAGGVGGAEAGVLDDPGHGCVMLDQRDLAGNLKGLRGGRRARIEPEHAGDRIETAQTAGVRLAAPCPRFATRTDHHPHPVAALDMVGQCFQTDATTFGQFQAQRFAGEIELVDVVVDVMEEIPHLLVGRGIGECAGAFQRLVELGQLIAGAAHGLMQRQESAGEGRCVLHHQLDVGERWLRPA